MSECMFHAFIGIDYSGASTPEAGLPGLRVYRSEDGAPPVEVRPSTRDPRRHWSRRTLAGWLVDVVSTPRRSLIGIDHGLSFPIAYFDRHELPRRWPAFVDDFARHWPTHKRNVRVEDVRRGRVGRGHDRRGDARWRRVTERRAGPAKSVFHFDVPGSVAKSTHAGLPWLRELLAETGDRVHVWPQQGWSASRGASVIAEVYPSRWRGAYPRNGRTDDQHDAYVVAASLADADRDGRLERLMQPDLPGDAKAAAPLEGWILGVP